MTAARKPSAASIRCEDIIFRGLLPCPHAAKYLTPLHKFATISRKVCGKHKHRYETATHKCTLIIAARLAAGRRGR
jgi:hypothetical protein